MTTESTIINQIRFVAQKDYNVYLWRNNSGVLKDARGVPVRFGLGNDSTRINKVMKSSDLIGIAPNGRFVAFEIKPPGWIHPRNNRELAQDAFLRLIIASGGIAGFVTGVRDVELQLAMNERTSRDV